MTVQIGYTNDTHTYIMDDVAMWNINVFIEGRWARMWQDYAKRFGKQYADEILQDVIEAGLKELGGLAAYDEEMEMEVSAMTDVSA